MSGIDETEAAHLVVAERAPAAIGPYSHAVVAGELVVCSGQLGLHPASGELVDGGTAAQTAQSLTNLAAVLEAAGSSMDQVLRTTVYLTDLGDFPAVNDVYAAAFGSHRPARVTVEVQALPAGASVEIECIARAAGASA